MHRFSCGPRCKSEVSLRYSAVGELTVTLQGSSNSFVRFCFTLSIISSRWVQCQVLKNSSKFCIFLCERISDDKRTPFLHYLPHGNTGQRPTEVLPSEIIWLKLFFFFSSFGNPYFNYQQVCLKLNPSTIQGHICIV